VKFLTTLLSLTATQQQQATTIFTNEATAETTVHDSMKTAHESLQNAVKANDTEAIDQTANTIGELTAQITSTHARAEAAFYQTLTADQQAKFAQLQRRPRDRGPFPGGGPGGPPDDRP
jgi:Spy/CpxP family protein refolding chaperone